MLFSKTSNTCMILQPEAARANKPTLSLFWKPSAEFLQLLHAHKPVTASRSPPDANWLTVGAGVDVRLCWCQAVLNWPFRGGPSWQEMAEEKEGREGKGKRQGRKIECLDKYTEQIWRHYLLFFNTISYCKFLSLQHTHSFMHTNTPLSQNLEKMVA